MASKQELETFYTLDEALKLYAIYQMGQDIEYFEAEEAKEKNKR